MTTAITDSIAESLVIGAAIIGILFGLLNAILILRIKVSNYEEEVLALRDDK